MGCLAWQPRNLIFFSTIKKSETLIRHSKIFAAMLKFHHTVNGRHHQIRCRSINTGRKQRAITLIVNMEMFIPWRSSAA